MVGVMLPIIQLVGSFTQAMPPTVVAEKLHESLDYICQALAIILPLSIFTANTNLLALCAKAEARELPLSAAVRGALSRFWPAVGYSLVALCAVIALSLLCSVVIGVVLWLAMLAQVPVLAARSPVIAALLACIIVLVVSAALSALIIMLVTINLGQIEVVTRAGSPLRALGHAWRLVRYGVGVKRTLFFGFVQIAINFMISLFINCMTLVLHAPLAFFALFIFQLVLMTSYTLFSTACYLLYAADARKLMPASFDPR